MYIFFWIISRDKMNVAYFIKHIKLYA